MQTGIGMDWWSFPGRSDRWSGCDGPVRELRNREPHQVTYSDALGYFHAVDLILAEQTLLIALDDERAATEPNGEATRGWPARCCWTSLASSS